jgi:hypothetical protein
VLVIGVTRIQPPVWWPSDADHEQVIADVKRRFPWACAWFGEYTGKWWALAGNCIVEADTPSELHERIASALEAASARRINALRFGVVFESPKTEWIGARAYGGGSFSPPPGRLLRCWDGVRRFLLGPTDDRA